METHLHKMLYSQIPCQVELHLLQTHFLLMEFLKVSGSIERCEYWDNNSRDYSNSFVPSYCYIITNRKPIVNFSSTSYQLVSPPDSETSISNPVSTQIKEAILSMTKNESVSFADIGQTAFILLLLPI